MKWLNKVQLHEQTQRFILLLIFYLLGPILTLGIIGGIVLRKLPSNARHWERTLTQQTGLHWAIKSVEYRSPGFVRLHKVQILDDSAKDPVFYAEQVDIRRMTGTRRDKIFPGIWTDSGGEDPAWSGLTAVLTHVLPSFCSNEPFWQITAQTSILDFRGYSGENSALLVQNMLQKVLARLDTLADVPVQFVFEDIFVFSEHSLQKGGNRAEDKADLFRFIQGNIYRAASEVRSEWSFEIRDISNTERLNLSFALSPTNTLDITLRTGKQPLPCNLAAVFYPAFKHFSGGVFRGEFILSTRSGHHSQTIRMNDVTFQNVPLTPLVCTYTDFAVTGTIADLQFDCAVFGAGGPHVEGRLQAKEGAVEKALFLRCIDNFGLRCVDNAGLPVQPESMRDPTKRMVPFTACVVWFSLTPDGIVFNADEWWLDAIMHQKINDKLSEWIIRLPSHRRTVTYRELMSVFVSDSAPTVPLTSGLKPLLQHVPIK